MLDSIVFDIDGTLADVTHRLHFLHEKKKNWVEFFREIPNDLPILEMVNLAQDLIALDRKPVIFATGRPEFTREMTVNWLKQHGVLVDFETRLFMRKDNDRRSDADIKSDMLVEITGAGFRPVLIFDDRQSVVDMWRSKGIRVAQIAPGKF